MITNSLLTAMILNCCIKKITFGYLTENQNLFFEGGLTDSMLSAQNYLKKW